jgi:hypothetical protein
MFQMFHIYLKIVVGMGGGACKVKGTTLSDFTGGPRNCKFMRREGGVSLLSQVVLYSWCRRYAEIT